MRLFKFDDPEHSEAADLLPWLATGTLEPAEERRVHDHLARCLACARELAALRELQHLYLQSDAEPQAMRGLARVERRIAQVKPAGPMRRMAQKAIGRWRSMPPWARVASVAQAAAIAALGTALLLYVPPKLYRTLGAANPPAAQTHTLVVIFDAGRTENEIRNILLRLQARIVDGPSALGAYTLEVPAHNRAATLHQLRHERAVMFAEPGELP